MSENQEAASAQMRVKIGPVKTFLKCTKQLAGCKAREMGNVFPVDHPHGSFRQPFDQVCSSCLTKMLDSQQWVMSQ